MQNEQQAISRRAGTVGGLTLLSRFAGLARDVIVAYAFGTHATADAFYVAFRVPNLVRRLLAEGAFTMAFLPIYSDYKQRSGEEAQKAANTVFTALFLFLLVLVGLGILLAPWIVKCIAYGFAEDPEKFRLTVSLARVMFPYLMMASLMALMMAMLNSWRHFAAPASAPILLNLAMIGGALVASQWFAQPVYGLAVGVLCGGLLQVAVQMPPLLKRHIFPRFTATLSHPSLKQLITLMIPATYGGAVYQVNVMVITLLASFLPSGSVSYLWYADRITEFPLGIFAIAVATVTLPTLSDQHSAGDTQAFRNTINYGLRIVMACAIPSAMGLIVLAWPIVRLLFEGGAFTMESSHATAWALVFFAVGIPFVSGVRNVVPAFFAMKDAKTPVKVATVALLVNFGAALYFMGPLKHAGLALAMVTASCAHFLLLVYFLRRKVGPLGGRRLVRSILGSVTAAVVMGIAVKFVGDAVISEALQGPLDRWTLLPRVLLCIAVGVVAYLPLLYLLNRDECRHLLGIISRRT